MVIMESMESMDSYNVAQAKSRFSEILEQIAASHRWAWKARSVYVGRQNFRDRVPKTVCEYAGEYRILH